MTLSAEEALPPSPDCALNVESMPASGAALWRRLSISAESVAPSATAAQTSGRRRATTPPGAQTFVARNFIDTEIFEKMQRDGIRWTGPSTDGEFLRRVTLDLTGEIPSPEVVTAFLDDESPTKRDKAIDRLLSSPAFADRWTMWFGDLVQNVQTATNVNETATGRNAYYKFIRDSIVAGKPYDKMVREAIANSGRQFSNGEVNYTVRDLQSNGPIQDTYDNLASSTASRFLGIPLVCVSCHSGVGHLESVNSALVKKTRLDFWKNAAFFAQITVTTERDAATNVTERILVDNSTGSYRLNTTSGNKSPRQPVNGLAVVEPAFILSGEAPASGEPRRAAYGRILTAHPQFARATANYLWKELFGLGIVEPANSFDLARQDAATLARGAVLQPTHPELMARLGDAFVASGYDLRAFLKLIVQSNAYQLSTRYGAGQWNEMWTPYYARHYPRRMSAEQTLDAIVTATGVPISITIANVGAVTKAMALPDPTEGGTFRNFLDTFGRGNRDDQARDNESSVTQALMLMNDRLVTDRIKNTQTLSTVSKTLRATRVPGAIADALYVATLSRLPRVEERQQAILFLAKGDMVKNTEDLQYVLLNRLDFLFY